MAAKGYSFLKFWTDHLLQNVKSDGEKSHGTIHSGGPFLFTDTSCWWTWTASSFEPKADVSPASIVALSLFLSFLIAHLFLYPIYSSIFPLLLEWFPAATFTLSNIGGRQKNSSSTKITNLKVIHFIVQVFLWLKDLFILFMSLNWFIHII